MSGSSNAATAGVGREGGHAGASAIQQPVLVVSSRLVEVLQPEELQMMFLTTLSTALAPGMLQKICLWVEQRYRVINYKSRHPEVSQAVHDIADT